MMRVELGRIFSGIQQLTVVVICSRILPELAMVETKTPHESLLKVIRVLELPVVFIAKVSAWLIVPMTAGLVYEVVSRYIFNAPTVWAYDMTYMFSGALFMLGSAYALRQGTHVRADFLLEGKSPRLQAMVDFILYVGVYFPAMVLFFGASFTYAAQSWAQSETYPQSPWMPIIYPLKIVMPVTLALLLIQGVAELLKTVWVLRHNTAFQRGE
jgi:TRAP-type mannitol/chloroaromatic compound transport system permease small subunit